MYLTSGKDFRRDHAKLAHGMDVKRQLSAGDRMLLSFCLHLQFEFGILHGFRAVEEIVSQTDQEIMARAIEETVSRIKAICEAFNRTYGKKLGQNVEQFCRGCFSPLSDMLKNLKPEIDKLRPDEYYLAYYEKLYWKFMATQEEIPGQGKWH